MHYALEALEVTPEAEFALRKLRGLKIFSAINLENINQKVKLITSNPEFILTINHVSGIITKIA